MIAPPKHSEGFPPMSQAKEMVRILTSEQKNMPVGVILQAYCSSYEIVKQAKPESFTFLINC